jgi:hypothetical protein
VTDPAVVELREPLHQLYLLYVRFVAKVCCTMPCKSLMGNDMCGTDTHTHTHTHIHCHTHIHIAIHLESTVHPQRADPMRSIHSRSRSVCSIASVVLTRPNRTSKSIVMVVVDNYHHTVDDNCYSFNPSRVNCFTCSLPYNTIRDDPRASIDMLLYNVDAGLP